jgi:hypothetical protein
MLQRYQAMLVSYMYLSPPGDSSAHRPAPAPRLCRRGPERSGFQSSPPECPMISAAGANRCADSPRHGRHRGRAAPSGTSGAGPDAHPALVQVRHREGALERRAGIGHEGQQRAHIIAGPAVQSTTGLVLSVARSSTRAAPSETPRRISPLCREIRGRNKSRRRVETRSMSIAFTPLRRYANSSYYRDS